MLLFWLLAFALALASIAAIAWPIVAPDANDSVRVEEDEELPAKIAAIERDRASGLIDDAGADASIAEAAAALKARPAAPPGTQLRKSKGLRMAALFALGVAPLAATHIYIKIGAPQALKAAAIQAPEAADTMDERAAAIAAMPEDQRLAMIETMVTGLASRLASEPEDVDGWRMLARSYRVLGRHAESAAAWREALARADGGVEDWRGLSLALLDQRPEGDDSVSAETEAALERLRAFDPDDPLALFFLGHAARNRGDAEAALLLWRRLRELLPPDAPITPSIDQLIAETSS